MKRKLVQIAFYDFKGIEIGFIALIAAHFNAVFKLLIVRNGLDPIKENLPRSGSSKLLSSKKQYGWCFTLSRTESGDK
jgi:hypothetical protein